MMENKEYIEREELLQSKDWLSLQTLDRARAKAIILGRRAADVVEVRYGYWEAYWDDGYLQYYHRCSECKSDAPAKQGTMCDQVLTVYCPHCGVNMGGKDGDK